MAEHLRVMIILAEIIMIPLDKLLHLLVGFSTTVALHTVVPPKWAVTLPILGSVGWEVARPNIPRTESYKDIGASVIGISAGASAVWLLQHKIKFTRP